MRWYLVTLAVLLIGCTSPNQVDLPANLVIDPGFNSEQTETIVEAARRWRVATAGAADLTVTMGSGEGPGVHVRPGSSTRAMGTTDIPDSGRATVAISLGLIDAEMPNYRQTESELVLFVVMHELGHVFGIDHIDHTLMQAGDLRSDPTPPCVDAVSLSVFCADYACPPGVAATCPSP